MVAPKAGFPPDYPKQCPCAHKHLSWSLGDEEVYCWDCDRKYPLFECFGPRTKQEEEADERAGLKN
jgi:hypothetical protein